MENKIAAIILAGGMSRRMGNENKLFAHWHGQSLVYQVCDTTVGSNIDKVIVVGGHELHRLIDELCELDVTVVNNENYKSGMATSVVSGVQVAANGKFDGVLIMLGDMPQISVGHINLMIDAFGSNNREKIITAAHHGKRGNPVLWPAKYFPQLLKLAGDKGARDILNSLQHEIKSIEIGDAAHSDIDTIGDLDRLRK